MPASGDYKFCPWLTVTALQEGSFTAGETTYCDKENDLGNKGWLDPYDSVPGCGRVYDCCVKVVPVACMGADCILFNNTTKTCSLNFSGDNDIDNSVSLLALEYLTGKDQNDDGQIYGHTYLMSNPPPALAGITKIWGSR